MHTAIDTRQEQESFIIHPIYGEFICRRTEQEFKIYRLPETVSQLRVSLMFCAISYPAYALADAILKEQSEISHGLLLLCLLAGSAYGLAAFATGLHALKWASPKPVQLIAYAAVITGTALPIACQFLMPDGMIWHTMLMSIMLFTVIHYMPCKITFSIFVSAIATFTFQLSWLRTSESISVRSLCMTTFFLSITILTAGVAARWQRKLRREEYHARSVLKRLSIHDPLTDCYNRRHLSDLMESELARAKRQKQWLTVILCDLDHFKSVNDTYGHPFGDTILKRFASLLLNMTRDYGDSVVRYGGEEFLLVLSGTDMAGGKALAERLRTAFSEKALFDHFGKQIPVTASFGVVSIDFTDREYITTQKEIIQMADKLLYEAKRAGRDRVIAAKVK